MKTLLIAAAMLIGAAAAQAQTLQCDTFGSMQRCRGPNGYTSTEDTFGTMTRGRDNKGNTWTTDRFGDRSTTRFQPSMR
jgi:hypothetical protein